MIILVWEANGTFEKLIKGDLESFRLVWDSVKNDQIVHRIAIFTISMTWTCNLHRRQNYSVYI